MAKSDLKRMSGTPWHVGYVTKKEDDPRRDKRLCAHYNEGHCNFRCGKCIGSSHCTSYKRNGTASKKQQKNKAGEWKKEVQIVSIPGIIQRGDTVLIRCGKTREEFSFTIANGDAELPPIHKLCLGKKRKDHIFYGGYDYCIISFIKADRIAAIKRKSQS